MSAHDLDTPDPASDPFVHLLAQVEKERQALVAHPVYERVDNIHALRVFMTNHVFAVWDFMTLVKRLQRDLTCVADVWVPPADDVCAFLINDIVRGEESDEVERNRFISHYELYHLAMIEVDADPAPMRALERAIRAGEDPEVALERVPVPRETRDFTAHTLRQARLQTHEVAAAFLLGREDVIPWMFKRLLGALDRSDGPLFRFQSGVARFRRRFPDKLWEKLPEPVHGRIRDFERLRPDPRKHFRLYLERHIEVDEGHHAPMGKRMLRLLCEDDPTRWAEATEAARSALRARVGLWDGVMREIQGRG